MLYPSMKFNHHRMEAFIKMMLPPNIPDEINKVCQPLYILNHL
jgi:hypothetical protein